MMACSDCHTHVFSAARTRAVHETQSVCQAVYCGNDRQTTVDLPHQLNTVSSSNWERFQSIVQTPFQSIHSFASSSIRKHLSAVNIIYCQSYFEFENSLEMSQFLRNYGIISRVPFNSKSVHSSAPGVFLRNINRTAKNIQ
jgi:hypothetical protein